MGNKISIAFMFLFSCFSGSVYADIDFDSFGYGESRVRTDEIFKAVRLIRRLQPEFQKGHDRRGEMGDALRSLHSALDNRGAVASGGPFSVEGLRILVGELIPADGAGAAHAEAITILARLALQDAADSEQRRELEKEIIARSKVLDDEPAARPRFSDVAFQPGTIEALGEIGSLGRLEEPGQLYLLHLSVTHLTPSEQISAEKALKLVRPKSEAVVNRILAILTDEGNKNRGALPKLVAGLQTETSDAVIKVLVKIAKDPSHQAGTREAAMRSLLGGQATLSTYRRPEAWRNKAIRDAILEISRSPSQGIYGDSAVTTAKEIAQRFQATRALQVEGGYRRPQLEAAAH